MSSKKRCKYGKLKSPSKGRRCKKARSGRGRRSPQRRSRRRSYRAAKVGGGLLALVALGAGGAIYYWSQNAPLTPPTE